MKLRDPFHRDAAFDRYLEPAILRAQLWRTMLGGGLIALVTLGLTFALGFALVALFPTSMDPLQALQSAESVLFALSTFAIWWIAIAFTLLVLHRRGVRSLFGPGPGARGFFAGLLIALALGLVGLAIGAALVGWPVRAAPSLADWALGAALAVPLLLIQTGAEEALFRGYFLQQLAARFRSPLIWAVLPSLAFGALHWNPLAPGGAWPIVLITGAVGLVLAAVTVRTGGLAVAWGLHFGVNLMAIVFVSSPDYLSGIAFAHWSAAGEATLIWLDFALILVAALTAWVWWSAQSGQAGCD